MPDEPSVEELLKTKIEESEKNTTQISDLTKANNTLKAEISMLNKKVKDVQQASNSYTQSLEKMEEEKKYAKKKNAVIKDEITDEIKGKITKDIDKIDTKITELQNDEDKFRKKVKKCIGEKENAQEDLEKKQKNYETLKNTPKSVDGDIKDLKAKIDQSEKDEKKASMYFLIGELNKILDNPKSPEDLTKELYAAQVEIDTANTTLQGKDDDLKASQAELDQKRKERGEFNRRIEILKLLNKY